MRSSRTSERSTSAILKGRATICSGPIPLTGDNEKNVPPHGESGEQMKRRALAALERIQSESVDAIVVTHGGVIAAVMAQLFPNENKSRYEWQSAPGSGYVIENGAYTPFP